MENLRPRLEQLDLHWGGHTPTPTWDGRVRLRRRTQMWRLRYRREDSDDAEGDAKDLDRREVSSELLLVAQGG